MSYFRAGHCDQIFVKVGDKVKKGDKIATVGDGNGLYKGASHIHADFPKEKLSPWTAYVFGMTKEKVKKLYADPKKYRPKWYDHMGWGYLEYATYGSKKCYHPGEDWNGKGAGDSDKGLSIKSPFNGEVVYAYKGESTNAGWGKLLVVAEKKEEPKNEPKKKEEIKVTQTPKEDTKTVSSAIPSVSEPIVTTDTKIDYNIGKQDPYIITDFEKREENLREIEKIPSTDDKPLWKILLNIINKIIRK